MFYKDNPKGNWVITGIVLVIGIFILFFAVLPFLRIHSDFIKALLIVIALLVASYPLGKYFLDKNKNNFEKRNGRKLN